MNQLLKTDIKNILFGADPEIFLTLNGKVVGSERAIPKAGIASLWFDCAYSHGKASCIRDGVQVELNLPPTHCREWLALEIQGAFRTLQAHLNKMEDQQFAVSFRQVVDVDPAELASLTPTSRQLGCMPSFNWYHPGKTIGVNPDTYTKRSAGGHLHFGLPDHLKAERERLPPLFDILLGNTSVLIDRDPNAAERRKVYGRAGEFRLPRHGIEYRTLSNFWLRSKELVGLVTGLGRLAILVLDTSIDKGGWAADEALLDLVSLKDVEEAINTADVKLAKANFEGVRTFLTRHHRERVRGNDTGLYASNLGLFDKFVEGIDRIGLEFWFPEDPMTHWQHCDWCGGWERFLETLKDRPI